MELTLREGCRTIFFHTRAKLNIYDSQNYYRLYRNLPRCKHGKLFIGRTCKKRADDQLKLDGHQLRLIAATLTGHAPVRCHLCTAGCMTEIHPADSVDCRPKQCSTLFVAARPCLFSAIIFLGNQQ